MRANVGPRFRTSRGRRRPLASGPRALATYAVRLCPFTLSTNKCEKCRADSVCSQDRGYVAAYYRLWPLWARLHQALDYPPVYHGELERRWTWRPLVRPRDYARWVVLGIEDRAGDLRPYIGAADLARIDAQLARAGVAAAAAGPARDAACLGLGLARLATGQPVEEAAWRLGVPHGLPGEARYLRRVDTPLRGPLVAGIVARLADQQAPADGDEHHHDDVERHQREAGAEVLAAGDAQRRQQ